MHGCSGGWGQGGCVWFYLGGHAWFYSGGACVVLFGGACMVLFRGACVVLFRGHAWFYLGGHVWFYLGGVWFYSGSMRGFIRGACVVLFRGGMHGFFNFFGYNEIQSMSGRYTSYWNAFLYKEFIHKTKQKRNYRRISVSLVIIFLRLVPCSKI